MMIKKAGLSQEILKLIACVTMLIDHAGAVLFPQYLNLRIIGRIAFPIYCFLLAEGVIYTKSPMRYGIRLGVGAVLSELPFDLALFGGITLQYQSVMITLLIGFVMGNCMKCANNPLWKVLIILPFALLAEWLKTDYGGWGIVMIALFILSRDFHQRLFVQATGLAVICYVMDSYVMFIGGLRVPIEMFALFAMVPIALYSGEKLTRNKALQWAFYLFYPVHLTILFILWEFGYRM